MEHSILAEATSENLGVFLNNRVYDKLYYLDFFPVKTVRTLTYETLIGSKGNRVAADVVAYNSSAPEKRRKVISRLTGDIPPIRMKKIMRETDLNLYNQLKSSGTTDINELLALVFGDVDACIDGVNARLEWLAIQAMAGGTITLSTTNSAGIVTEDVIDFQLPSANKEVEAAANNYWTTGAYATNTPITDIDTIQAEARAAGSDLKWIIMNRTKWVAFRTSTQVQNYTISESFVGATRITMVPRLEQVNEMLRGHGYPQIVVVDTSVDIETKAHGVTSYDPWLDSSSADRYVLFSPTLQLGNTLVGPIAMETNTPKQATIAKKGHILVSKWGKADPVAEYTSGETNAFPSWPTIDQCWILDTESHTTYGA